MPYRVKIAIDFGSTNTVVAWKIYDVDANGSETLSAQLNPANNFLRIPTSMVLRDDNPGLPQDYFGDDAANLINDANNQHSVVENFKQLLYNESSDSENYRMGVEFTKKFFSFLFNMYRNRIIGNLPGYVTTDMKNTLYLSTPVRANPIHRKLMRDIAEEAGFNNGNNFDKICTDFDEATCVIRYAVENSPTNMANFVQNGAIVLFVDVGGSTMDMALLRVSINPAGKFLLDTISLWPNADEKYLLGGSLIDVAIRDYLIDRGFAVEDHTLQNWDTGNGKFRFRKLKEDSNSDLRNGNPITQLGMNFLPAIFDPYGQPPPVRYGNNDLITPDIFENVICKEYIENMNQALQQLFSSQRQIANQAGVNPRDVDAIILSGAGSNLYFIRNVFLRQNNGFTKIIQQPERLMSAWNIDSSLCCALGALVETSDNMDIPGYSREDYKVRLCLYIQNKNIENFLRNNPGQLTPENDNISYTDNRGRTIQVLNQCIFDSGLFKLADKFQRLPANPFVFKTQVPYTDHLDYKYVVLQLHMFRKNSDGEYIKVSEPVIATKQRNLIGELLAWLPGKVRANVQLTLMMNLFENYDFTAIARLNGKYFSMSIASFDTHL